MPGEQFSCPASDDGCAPVAFFIGKLQEHADNTNRRLDTIERKLDAVLTKQREPSWLSNASTAIATAIGTRAGVIAFGMILVALAAVFGLTPSTNFVPEIVHSTQGSHP